MKWATIETPATFSKQRTSAMTKPGKIKQPQRMQSFPVSVLQKFNSAKRNTHLYKQKLRTHKVIHRMRRGVVVKWNIMPV